MLDHSELVGNSEQITQAAIQRTPCTQSAVICRLDGTLRGNRV